MSLYNLPLAGEGNRSAQTDRVIFLSKMFSVVLRPELIDSAGQATVTAIYIAHTLRLIISAIIYAPDHVSSAATTLPWTTSRRCKAPSAKTSE